MNKKAVGFILENEEKVRRTLTVESVKVYEFLITEFGRGPVTDNPVFQFVFRSFFRMDNAGLTDDFKKRFFELMEECRGQAGADYKSVSLELYKYPNRKGQQSLQFSFVSKLFSIIDCSRPVYDSEVARLFEFKVPSRKLPVEERICAFEKQLESIRQTYAGIIASGEMRHLIEICREHVFKGVELTDVKALDFIFWSGGKLKD